MARLLGKDLLEGLADADVLLRGGSVAQGMDMGREGLAAALLGGVDRGEHRDQAILLLDLVAALVEQPVELIDVGAGGGITDLLTEVAQQVGEPHGVAGLVADVVGELAAEVAGLAIKGLNQDGELLAGALLIEAVAVEKQHLHLALLHHLGHHLARSHVVDELAGIGDGHGQGGVRVWGDGKEAGATARLSGWAEPSIPRRLGRASPFHVLAAAQPPPASRQRSRRVGTGCLGL